jgi:hypothetical protein
MRAGAQCRRACLCLPYRVWHVDRAGNQRREHRQSPQLGYPTTSATSVTVRGINKPVVIIPGAGPRRGGRAGNERACSGLASEQGLADASGGNTVGTLCTNLPACH